MIGLPPSFYDPSDPQWQQRAQQQHPPPAQQQFDFSYPAPGTSYEELLAQYYPQHPSQYMRPNQIPPTPNTAAKPRQPVQQRTPPQPTATASSSAPKRKRVAKKPAPVPASSAGYSDSDSEDGFGSYAGGAGISVGMGGLGVRSKGARLPGACTHCKKLKMKCEFAMDGDGEMDNTCRRCRAGGHVCIVEGRKPRSAPNKREYLLAQIRQKDAIIESLLKQLHNPYIATPLSIASYKMATSPSDTTNRNIIAWLDRLQASVRSGQAMEASSSAATFAALARDTAATIDGAIRVSKNSFDGSEDDDLKPNTDDDDGTEEGDGSVLPDASVPIGLLANLSLSSTKEKKSQRTQENGNPKEDADDLDDDNVGVANASYFKPGPSTDLNMRAQLIEQHSPPEILIHGLVVPEDVDKLFDIFYTRVNPFIALLDPVLHTPASTFARCPFLFTVICAISSRYYPEKSEIYPIAMHFAKHSAATALIDGWKSVELVQAYILMSIYAVPARKWEEDRSWLYTGLAIRLATDLNLHQVPTGKTHRGNERLEREQLNRTRVWMICFNLDRSTATQFGKPATIKDDYIMRHGSDDWYKKSPYNSSYDIHMCCYTALLRLVASFHDDIFSDPASPTGLNKRVDFRSVTLTHDAHLTRFTDEWAQRLAQDSDATDRKCILRCKLFPFLVAYSRLVMFSFGFQQAYQRGLKPSDHIFFTKCLESAKSVVRGMVEGLTPTGFMRYAPDGHFIFAAFASAFLMKLLRPEFSQLMAKEEENEVFDLIGRLIQTLSSPEIAIDDRHTPKLYARFLAGLLSKHRRDGGATVGRLHPNAPPTQQSSASTPTASSSMSDYRPLSTNSTFSTSPMASVGSYGQQHQYTEYQTPAYRHESTYSPQRYHVQAPFSPEVDLEFGMGAADDDQMLAAMQALKNPAWWDNMMMPGFSWPESSGHGSPSSISNTSNGSPSPYPTPGHFAQPQFV
ncbi:hypothetical protein MIND_01213800 [Mycena indigotica]|uniref:Zn(2)-C6 fungal-type domain-containing protein n=1 Tax=Mycena indigotica TaxID=2126181 RepID=A0A8H6S466_9AGAR|nr:uncharacterized protein MIND_01213800 [Mycena indigotica]KAF7291885.1 hypothetical protein MIND_01213800 [Mycena indigotica]